jgi:RNA 3'-terminal phosphate cyclase (ATP)
MLEIDGSYGEGGGQLLRTAVALSALTRRAVRVCNIRARRDKPGLAPQHLAAVRAVATLASARTEGLDLRSQAIEFFPGDLRGGRYRFDVGTAGSVTLVLQALLPVMVAGGAAFEVTVVGGTDVRAAPPIDYFGKVLLALLHRMGASAAIAVRRRGYYPRGGGEVEITVRPGELRPIVIEQPGELRDLTGLAHVGNLPEDIATRMRSAALDRLGGPARSRAEIATSVLGPEAAVGHGGAIVAWARTEHTVLGAGRVAERGVRAEMLGEAVGDELAGDLASGATLDVHAADQLLVYLALAGGGAFTTRTLTSHAQTAIWLIEKFLPVRFRTSAGAALTRVEVLPR